MRRAALRGCVACVCVCVWAEQQQQTRERERERMQCCLAAWDQRPRRSTSSTCLKVLFALLSAQPASLFVDSVQATRALGIRRETAKPGPIPSLTHCLLTFASQRADSRLGPSLSPLLLHSSHRQSACCSRVPSLVILLLLLLLHRLVSRRLLCCCINLFIPGISLPALVRGSAHPDAGCWLGGPVDLLYPAQDSRELLCSAVYPQRSASREAACIHLPAFLQRHLVSLPRIMVKLDDTCQRFWLMFRVGVTLTRTILASLMPINTTILAAQVLFEVGAKGRLQTGTKRKSRYWIISDSFILL